MASRLTVFAAGTLFGALCVVALLFASGYRIQSERPLPPMAPGETPAIVEPAPAAGDDATVVTTFPTGEEALPPDPQPAPAPAPPPLPILPAVEPATMAPTSPTSVAPAPPALEMPVAGFELGQLADTFTQARGTDRVHDAIDLMAPRGTPVVAVADGRIAKLFTSEQGGLTVYQFDVSETYAYYYAHLDAYSPGLVEGAVLKRGDPIGTVGSTGNANPAGPHLHFAVVLLGPEKKWWKGTAVNPYPLLGGRTPP